VEAARQFLIQVGVFNNIANAEELRAKIVAGGVPARIEARVQVGPFASREEAEQAREKLKALGVEPGLVVAARK
jgi:DedD protein